MLTVLEMAPERNGWAAAIIVTWAFQGMERSPPRGLNAQSKTARCSSLRCGAPSIVSFLVDVVDDGQDLGLVVTERLEGESDRAIDDLEHPAAGELLVLDEGDVGLDARRVAIHQEADRAGRGEDGGLGVAEAVGSPAVEDLVPDVAAAAFRSAGQAESMASTASRCICMTWSIGSRFSSNPSNGPTAAASSVLARLAAPCSSAVIAPQTPRAASESYGRPLAMIRLPRFE